MLQRFPAQDRQIAATTAVLRKAFGVEPAAARHLCVPYRICPLGAHVDHQGGHALGRTIHTGTVLAYAPLPEPQIRLVSTRFPDRATFAPGTAVQRAHWARYAQAAALALGSRHSLTHGLAGAVDGTLVGAGLGSSASVGLAFLQALANVNGLTLTPQTLVELDFQLEHTYLGLQNGILDQSSILFGCDNALVHIDTRRRATRLIPDQPAAKGVIWLVVDSGVTRELTTGTGYNQRVAECRAAAHWLQPTAVMLSDISPQQFAAQAGGMPAPLRRRAAHFFDEVARVDAGVAAWQTGDFDRFGALMNASCDSSIRQYETGHEALVALQAIVSAAPGVYGSRFSGAGFGGCVIALADRAQAAAAAAQIATRYGGAFPQLAGKAAVYADAAEGLP